MQLQYNTVRPELLDIIKQVSADPFFKGYRLVGGTSLSLQIGHRASVDADFFSDGNGQPVPELLKYVYPTIIKNMAKVEPLNGCMGFTANGVKLDLFDYGDPFVKEAFVVDGIKLASLVDIGLMKLDVQNRRNAWKDLIDLNSITDIHPLSELLSLYNKRYPALPLKQAVMSLIQNLNTPPSLETFPSDLMFKNTNPNDVVISLKDKWASLYKSISEAQKKDVKENQEQIKQAQPLPNSDLTGIKNEPNNPNEQKPKRGIGY
jgi:hypothetical protein